MLRPSSKTKTFGGACRWLVASLAVVALLAAAPAHAAPVQFAQFNETTANQPFSFTNNGGTSGTIAYNSATPITFNFTAATGLSTADRTATLSISSLLPGPSTFTPATGLSVLDQQITQPTVLKITEVGGPSPGANLLTLTFTGDIVGRVGGSNASLAGGDNTGQLVQYTSDFLTFMQPGNSYLLGLSQITPGLSLGAGNFLNSFIANIQGAFTANVIAGVPAPTSVTMFGTGIIAASVLTLRQRKRLAKVNKN
jgi:hypothetical protein